MALSQKYNANFLHGGNSQLKSQFELFESDNNILPGTYQFDIYVNKYYVDKREVSFIRKLGSNKVIPCLSLQDLQGLGLIYKPEETSKTNTSDEQCFHLSEQIAQASINYDAGVQRLDISIPQKYMASSITGSIPKSLYDAGINAGFINYNFNGNHWESRNQSYGNRRSDYYYLSLRGGLNLGGWYLRTNQSINKGSGRYRRWSNLGTHVQKELVSLRSRLILGQSHTNSDYFDSFEFRGAKLFSADDMLPNNLQDYAPVVRGVASSNARVEIKQNGYLVYSTNVSPGPFELTDIYPSNTSGNLDVKIIEADGTVKRQTVAFSSVQNMIRSGIWRYQAAAGRYHSGNNSYKPKFFQGTVSRGFDSFTPYAGLLAAEHYHSVVFGVGKNMGFLGALSLDVSRAKTDLASGSKKTGNSYRFLYSKTMNNYGTQFNLVGHRYSSKGYYDFEDAVNEREQWRNGTYRAEYYDDDDFDNNLPTWLKKDYKRYDYRERYNNKRSKLEFNINQQLFGNTSVYFNGYRQNYWNESRDNKNYQLGVSTNIKGVSISAYLQKSEFVYGRSERMLSLNISIPFSLLERKPIKRSQFSDMSASFNTQHSKLNGNRYSMGVYGSALDDNKLNYSLNTSHDRNSQQSTDVSLNYQASNGNVGAGYSYGHTYRQLTYSGRGGMLIHSGGVTLTQSLSETMGLIEAKDAKDLKVYNSRGLNIDRFGYAVQRALTPYRYNTIKLDLTEAPTELDIDNPVQRVVPLNGAIVKMKFETRTGQNLLATIHLDNQKIPAIGTSIFNQDKKEVGMVGTNGIAYITGVKDGEQLTMKWGMQQGQSCQMQVPKQLPLEGKVVAYRKVDLQCG